MAFANSDHLLSLFPLSREPRSSSPNCEYSTAVWKCVLLRTRPSGRLFSNWQELLSWIKRDSQQAPAALRCSCYNLPSVEAEK
ncbi:hypothetical protein F2Q69_00019875 [Brassica cretica]|uniref:Uncharacterized protein n=2 Tax=Brassica TaxID=3705 RepID=A0A8S9Q917_BRACR|nr:hypothetical protein F2Q69_00019875 [Brassica cretica]